MEHPKNTLTYGTEMVAQILEEFKNDVVEAVKTSAKLSIKATVDMGIDRVPSITIEEVSYIPKCWLKEHGGSD